MSDNVINIQHKSGPVESFAVCPCTDEGVLVTPVVLLDQQGPIITSLMCLNCEKVIPVVNGVLQQKED